MGRHRHFPPYLTNALIFIGVIALCAAIAWGLLYYGGLEAASWAALTCGAVAIAAVVWDVWRNRA